MKLFKISQTTNDDYDTFDSAIVAAHDEKTASRMHPEDGSLAGADETWGGYLYGHTWCRTPADVSVYCIGTAARGTIQGVILASFNAG